jgi:DNA-binding Xre family transcriptional regulator
MANLYESILALCERDGIRPGRLCDELGISRGLMTDLKMGRKKGVNAETAQKIASFFGVSVGHLLGIEGSDAVNENTVNLEQVDVAFYGDFKELSEEEKETVRDMVRIMRQRRADKQGK